MATRQQPRAADFPDPSLPEVIDGYEWECPTNGLTYVYVAKDKDGKDIPGYWRVWGYPGPAGPQGPQGPGGLAGSYPTINETSGTWDLAHQEYDKDGNLLNVRSRRIIPRKARSECLALSLGLVMPTCPQRLG